jgi:hypothetical protein
MSTQTWTWHTILPNGITASGRIWFSAISFPAMIEASSTPPVVTTHHEPHPMKSLSLFVSFVLLSSIATAGELGPTQRLFDGKSFAGWSGDTTKTFRIEDGCIVGGSLNAKVPNNEFLTHEREFRDFELRLKFKIVGKEKVNAGVQVRSRRIPNHFEMIGYQADLGDGYWGSLYDESRRRKVLAASDPAVVAKVLKLGEWNEYVIRCEGKRIQLSINGTQTVDYTEADDSIEQTGLIGLQIHSGPPTEAWYKDVEIREIK